MPSRGFQREGPMKRFEQLYVVKLASVALLAAALFPASLFGQAAESTLRGSVVDSSGAVVPGVQIQVRNVGTNIVVRSVTTNENGTYEIPDIQVGTYTISAELPGFKTAVVDGVQIESSQTRRIDLTLEAGDVTEAVTVEAGAAVITTDSAQISDAFDDKKFDATPTTRTYYPQAYMVTLAGIDTQQGSYSLRFSGQPSDQVSEGMDGVTEDGTVNLINNMLDFRELRVISVNAPAEYARVANFNMVSKSGTNTFRGRVQWQHFNSALNARNFFESQETNTIENKGHVEVSGPIIKDKTHFYFSYFRQDVPGGSFARATVPTLKMRQGDFSEINEPLINPLTNEPFPNNQIPSSLLNPTALALQESYIAEPNEGGAGQIANNLFFTHDFPDDLFRADYPMVRIDHQFSRNNSIYGRWIHRYTPYVLKGNLPGFEWTRVRKHYGTVISDTHVFSSRLVNSVRFGWLYDNVLDGETVSGRTPIQGHEVVEQIGLQGVNPSGIRGQGFPTTSISGFSTLSVTHGGQAQKDHQFSFQDAVTWSRGRHVMKFGGDFKYLRFTAGRIPTGTFGELEFNGRFTGYAYADFLLGIPHSSARTDPLLGRPRIAQEVGLFFSDTFNVNDKLTLDYGIRWDYFPSAYYQDNLMYRWDPVANAVVVPPGTLSQVSPLYPDHINLVEGQVLPSADHGNFRPRIGVAYRLNDQTVLRGGYGAFTEQIGYFSRLPGSAPFDIAETYTTNEIVGGQPTFAFPNPFPGDIGEASIPSQSVSGFPMETQNGTIHQFNVTLERQFGDIGVRASYVGSRSRGLNYSLGINKPEPSLTPFSVDRRPYPQFSSVSWDLSNGKHTYNALQLQVQKRAGVFAFSAHYTLQSSLSNYLNREDPYIYLSRIGSGGLVENEHEGRWNREAYDARHKFAVNTTWQIPVGRESRYLSNIPAALNYLIGGWQLTTISYFKSGQYFSPHFSGADPSNTNTFGGLPDRIGDGNLPADQRSLDRWFDPSAFRLPQAGTYGNSGVNVLEGPGIHVHHINLLKRFALTDRIRLEYSAAISNLFNRPHFEFPRRTVIGASDPGVITDARDSNQDQEKAGQRMIEMTLRVTW